MSDDRFVEFAVRIRMACSRPDVRGQGFPPVFVSFSRDEALRCNSVTALCCADGSSPDAVGDAVAMAISQTGIIPGSVAVEKLGVFSIDVPDVSGRPRLPGCAAIVTGSAQGFGRGIAEELVADGAHVVIADLNEPLGTSLAEELNAKHGAGTAVFSRVDVTDLDSIETCVTTCVAAFGGVDMLVSNAGVLKAGGLDELDEAGFDLVTSVNYKAYFLCAKGVTPVMKLQHVANPSHFMDIIQINSKSGLAGSNRNFAYAGSKFGSIGLTQSFALELISQNIKVNAICPGNYFDGPLWSDPEKGLFVQYLHAGKVPGAETVEDVKAFYMSKVPMGRGCEPADVARTILYVHDQQYETGQAIPVTGGQVMLN